jgi:ABC-type dipeptide/oligopeptide/nickel transport system ATPase component
VDALPGGKPAGAYADVGVKRVEVSGFGSARHVAFSPGPLSALVGEANAGKSNLLAAIRAALDPAAAPLTARDMTEGGENRCRSKYASPTAVRSRSKGARARNTVTGGEDAPPTLPPCRRASRRDVALNAQLLRRLDLARRR